MQAFTFDDVANVGLYDPDQFDQGRLLQISVPYGGEEHYLRGPGYEGVLGYSITYRGAFGWQILDPKRTCAAIVNIGPGKNPTQMMIDDMLADIRSDLGGNTIIITSPRCKNHAINRFKQDLVQLVNNDNEAKTRIDTWNGISIITTHTIADQKPHFTDGFRND